MSTTTASPQPTIQKPDHGAALQPLLAAWVRTTSL